MSLHENISSLYDDELDAIDRESVFDSLKQGEAQKQLLNRYSLIGDALRKNLPDKPDHDLFSRVQASLESEPVLLAPSPTNIDKVVERTAGVAGDDTKIVELPAKPANDHTTFKLVSGFSIAASVALVSVLGFQMFSQPANDFSQPMVAITSPLPNTQPSTQVLNLSPAIESVALVSSDADAPAPVNVDDVVYAQQSVMDAGQWTRITRIADILLDNNMMYQPSELQANVGLNTTIIPFARASNLEAVKQE